MTATPILVLGSTGKTGRRVVSRLRQRNHEVRAASRTAWTRFDWNDASTWAPAVEGVERLVLLSARDWAVSGDAAMLAGERAVQDSGAGWTILRPTWFAQNFAEEPFLRDPVVRGKVVLPTGDGAEPFIDAEDIADVAVAALTEDDHAGQTYELSRPRLLTFGAAVEEIARATGRGITYRPVSPIEYAAHAGQLGLAAEFAATLNTLFGWIKEGRNAVLSDGVQRVLGRAPRDITDYITATAATGVWSG